MFSFGFGISYTTSTCCGIVSLVSMVGVIFFYERLWLNLGVLELQVILFFFFLLINGAQVRLDRSLFKFDMMG
jgi:hypothetical protein